MDRDGKRIVRSSMGNYSSYQHTTARALLNGVGTIIEDSSNNLCAGVVDRACFAFERKGFTNITTWATDLTLLR